MGPVAMLRPQPGTSSKGTDEGAGASMSKRTALWAILLMILRLIIRGGKLRQRASMPAPTRSRRTHTLPGYNTVLKFTFTITATGLNQNEGENTLTVTTSKNGSGLVTNSSSGGGTVTLTVKNKKGSGPPADRS